MDNDKSFKLRMIDSSNIKPSPQNKYGIRDIEELAEDIKTNGLYHNLVVRPIDDGKYEIISGERRYRALMSLGAKEIPCQVRDDLRDLDIDAEIMLIQANAKARELTQSEKLFQVARLTELYSLKKKQGEKFEGKTRDLIGKDLGLSGVQVGRYQKINKKLIDEHKELLNEDKITLSQAERISSLKTKEQKELHEQIKDKDKKEIQEEFMKQEIVRERKFVPDALKLEKSAQPIKKMLDGLSEDIEFGRKINELLKVVAKANQDPLLCKTIITNRVEGSVISLNKKITIGTIAKRLIITTIGLSMQVEFNNIEDIVIDGDKAKLITKGMIIDF